MGKIAITFIIVLIVVVILFTYQLTIIITQLNKLKNNTPVGKENKLIKPLVFASVLFLIASLVLPFLFKNHVSKIPDELNEIGDALGGIMNPFIAFAGVIITGLAFWMQYQANQIVLEQIKQQKDSTKREEFRHWFYRQADKLRDLVMSFETINPQSGESSKGYSVFNVIIEQFNTLALEITEFNEKRNVRFWNQISKEYEEELKSKIPFDRISAIPEVIMDKLILFELSYIIVFFGVDFNGRMNCVGHLIGKYEEEYLRGLLNFLSNKSFSNGFPNNFFEDLQEETDLKMAAQDVTKRFYFGFHFILAHYYRQLYMCITTLNKSDLFSYEEKWELSKIIRTQFSNTEQIIFYVNSLCRFGREWELNRSKREELDLRLITKYDLIKNIPAGDREAYFVSYFYPEVEYEDLVETSNRKELNNTFK